MERFHKSSVESSLTALASAVQKTQDQRDKHQRRLWKQTQHSKRRHDPHLSAKLEKKDSNAARDEVQGVVRVKARWSMPHKKVVEITKHYRIKRKRGRRRKR